jgi:erythromycin esterase
MNTMSSFDRRTFLSMGTSAALGMPALTRASSSPPADTLQQWLAAHAHPIRTVDPKDDDFADLEPIAAAIGKARVVQLGEPSHNAGSCFAAKARLIQYLHQRLNFDVVVWESGIFDVTLAEAALRAGEDPSAAAQRGILRNWAGSEECRPLFVFAQQSHATARPLEMAGFDAALTSPFANLAAELRTFASAPANPRLQRDAATLVDEMIEAFAAIVRHVEARNALAVTLTNVTGDARKEAFDKWERETGAALRPNRAMLDRFTTSRDKVAELLRTHERDFARASSARQTGFMRRIAESLGASAANLYQRFGTDAPPETDGGVAGQNRRDACNADNLRWLIEHGYRGRKIVVWAHNAHVMNAYYEAPAWKTVRLDPAANTMKPHGVYLADWLGRDVYTIGFTAYEGEDGWKELSNTPIAASSEGSVEAGLHKLGHGYAFVDLEKARGPLRQPQTLRVPKYDEVKISDPTRPYDGLFYIARMERATLIRS